MAERVNESLLAGVRQKLPVAQRLSLRPLFGRRWWWKTLLVLMGMAVCLRLAVWQVQRLEQRKARNAETMQLLALPAMDLNHEALAADAGLRYRRASAHGSFDFSHQVALELKNWNGAAGIHLLAPLVLAGSDRAVLVDRGWIPFELSSADNWSQFDEPGAVTISGSLQTPQKLPGSAADGPQQTWYRVDLEAIQAQMPYELLPLYVVQAPGPEGNRALPYRAEPQIDLSNGPHLNYVIQWLCFALILGGGYLWYVAGRA